MNDSTLAMLLRDEPLEGVLRITLNRPPVNALSRGLVSQVQEAAEDLGDRPDLRAVLIGARGKAFCAGADLKERHGMSDDEVIDTVHAIGQMASAVASIPVPTIAVIGGAALGGGFELALACDLRVAAKSARVGLPECSLAIIPGAGGTQRLARLVGPARAKRWIFCARVEAASIALAEGLVDVVAAEEQLESTSLKLAGEIAACGPVALRAAKRAINRGLDAASLDEGLAEEAAAYRSTIPTEDRREALRAFAEKRTPRFTGE